MTLENSDAQRFWSKVEQPLSWGECWKFTGAKTNKGYSMFWMMGKTERAHRVVYKWMMGEIPETLALDHLCRNRACVNPYHLEAVTFGENVLRGIGLSAENARKTHCKQGHPLAGDNLVRYKIKQGIRFCRICYNKYRQERNQNNRIEVVSN